MIYLYQCASRPCELSVLYYKTVQRDFRHFNSLLSISLIHYQDGIMLTGTGEKERTRVLDALVSYDYAIKWEIKSRDVEGPATCVML